MGLRLAPHTLVIAISLGAAVAACGRPRPVVSTPASTPAWLSREKLPMKEILPTRMEKDLGELGLDVRRLPPLERVDASKTLGVMKTFSEALGIPCTGCHDAADFKADTRRKRVAKRMWNEMVRVVAFEDGRPVYCDSCHQGRLYNLDRRDKARVMEFMNDQYTGKLKRVDGQDHDCGTCHGDPPDFKFLAAWRSSPAPDIARAPDAPNRDLLGNPAPPAPAAPATTEHAPVAPKPPPVVVAPPPAKDCGDKNTPCPLQRWMRANMAPALAAMDAPALARALDRTASFSPDASWTWAAMSKTAADAARRGDVAEARKSCQACHNAYKEKWKASYRKRPVQ